MPSPFVTRQRRALSLAVLPLVIALVMPAVVSAQGDDSNGVTADEAVIAGQVTGGSVQKRLAGARADCGAFENDLTFKRGGQPGKGVVKRDFGVGNGDKGELVFADATTGTALFWTDNAGYLSAYMAAPVDEPDAARLEGLLFEGPPGSIARQDLLGRLVEQAAAADVTQERLFDTLVGLARPLDGECLWSSRFTPRKADRARFDDFWKAMVGQPEPEPVLLEEGRFMVDVTWRDVDGEEHLVTRSFDALGGDDDAPEYFFDVDGTELVVSLLDACSSNDHFWLFAASATDVEFDLSVTDTVSGQAKTYTNPLAAVPAITDSTAFATCP